LAMTDAVLTAWDTVHGDLRRIGTIERFYEQWCPVIPLNSILKHGLDDAENEFLE
jgi:hypothetical protein